MIHYPALDGLRALAILLVLLQHGAYGHFPGGYVGVDIFFVLSGFLITRVLVRSETTLGGFYLRRAQRLMPALGVMLILAALIWPFVNDPALSFSGAALPVIFYVADFQACINAAALGSMLPTWSLAVEEQFYLLWPLALILLNRASRSNRIRYTLAVAAVFLLLRPVLYHLWPWAMQYYSPLTRIDVLLVGCAIALMERPPRLLVPAYAFLAALPIIGLKLLSTEPLHYLGIAPIVTVAAVGLIAECVRPEPSRIRRVLAWPPFVWLGKRSYGIYLFHLPIFEALEHLRIYHSVFNFFWVSAVRFAATFAVAELSYRFVERPILALRFKRQPSPTTSI